MMKIDVNKFNFDIKNGEGVLPNFGNLELFSLGQKSAQSVWIAARERGIPL